MATVNHVDSELHPRFDPAVWHGNSNGVIHYDLLYYYYLLRYF